ncbi:Dehydrogenase (flavoprotein) [Actinopolymorpha cephalotaxi]|uniref:2-polyprenyl-6-methoxyphenol hydroxylase-like FAD-dependent oxidoreductase n=1 Tax=Actinopolymorpha cephalotaxi TaxID=504797 RepID=A0A1I2LMH3_9ACTN|nr:NAD(P)-binding protein [Actinopolymorpha cephalotaxi]NYH81352.1 2-polyprenyl-6-methoxyphenol hydroxylase-like FAD-dependent oxidoreductase [Actinopolymorpha cephalotaxi]SFF80313.1 Dehydrogenase (flavoprotein) [Actinopolymorpha cephalotaxi]
MRIAVVGGSLAGLVAAMLLGRRGHEVVVLDRDDLTPAGDPEAAAATAFRAGAPQIVQLHVIRPLGWLPVRRHLPDVYAGWLDAGVVEYPLAQQMPPTLADRSPRPGDDELTMLLFRRSTIDWVIRRSVAAEPGVDVRSDVRVTGLTAAAGDPPRVTGVTTDAGIVEADLVVDASGRRTRIDQWLRGIGARPTELTAAECGVAYYTRYYRLRPGATLPGSPAMMVNLPMRRFMLAMFGCDHDTVGMCLVPPAEDRAFKAVRDPAVFTAVARTVPQAAAWLDVMEPETGVYPMGDLHNTLRRLVVDGVPVATGILAVGDSLCTTNPTFARGIAFALQQVIHLADAVGEYPVEELTKVMDELTSTRIEPWFADQAAIDAARLAALRRELRRTPAEPGGSAGPGGSGGSGGSADGRVDLASLRQAAGFDPDLFRAQVRLLGMLTPAEEILADPAVVRRVREILASVERPPLPDPSDEELAAALAAR